MFDFDNKNFFFRQELKWLKSQNYGSLWVTVNRNKLFRIFEDSYEQLKSTSKEEMLGKLEV